MFEYFYVRKYVNTCKTVKDYEILETNLQPFFWRKVKNIIRQNKKLALQEFLFGKDADNQPPYQASRIQILEDQIQINSLETALRFQQQKIIQLQNNQTLEIKKALRQLLKPSQANKIHQQGDSTLKSEHSLNLLPNDPKRTKRSALSSDVLSEVQNTTSQTKDIESKSFLEASKSSLTTSQPRENISSNQEKALNQPNFITSQDNRVVDVWQSPGSLSEQEKIEIIQLGFQLNQERNISFKKYYESKDPNSLFQYKGYNIKYENIRRTKLYQQLKP